MPSLVLNVIVKKQVRAFCIVEKRTICSYVSCKLTLCSRTILRKLNMA